MDKYDHKKIEKKWQDVWEKEKLYEATDGKEKQYVLDMFPYPSGDGLHVGHVEGMTATDIYSRYLRMNGKNVLHPTGWDAFGLPAENYAIKTGIHPEKTTKKASDNFRRQIKSLGMSYDWSREIDTHTPKYYKWTQWLFLKLFENNLAYKKKANVNWCESCKTVLANEQVVNGECERCGNGVVQKDLEQWFFRTTDFAEELTEDLDSVDWPQSTVLNQKNWIGRSEGAELTFKIKDQDEQIKVFTTRPDTLFGTTYMVLAPDHELVEKLKTSILNIKEVEDYQKKALNKTDLERTAENKEKTGTKLDGLFAINPATNKEIPIYIADYVLVHYGTGAIMAVPAHDERDYAFATKFNILINEVIVPVRVDKRNPPVDGKKSVERENVHVIVKNTKNNKYLCLRWKKFPWTTFPMGGVDDGEEIVEAAKRELYEETGYKNVKLISVLGGKVKAEYFAAHKDQNRVSYTRAVYFELIDEKKDDISEKEKALHSVVWLDSKHINTEDMVHAEMDIWLERLGNLGSVYTGEGELINSGEFDGMISTEAKEKITKSVGGKMNITYKLRDWLVSRQRYWGVPIPIVYDKEGVAHPVPEKHLPWLLPTDVEFKPTGVSPLSKSKELQKRVENLFGDGWTPEVDTMDTFVCSSWYFLRFVDPHNDKKFADKKLLKKWLPVDMYMGGAEHTVLHLMYARFITKVLHKLGFVNFNEPFKKLRHQGMILAPDGKKMSKSLGNVINPDDAVENVGADTLRMYEMFMGPLNQAIPWNTDNMVGLRRFLERVWRLQEKIQTEANEKEIARIFHKTIKKVGEDIVEMKFNTAISSLMILQNKIEEGGGVSEEFYKSYIILLAPFAPHITEEIWANIGEKGSIHQASWPKYDKKLLVEDNVTIVVQVNGKIRGKFEARIDSSKEEILATALDIAKVKEYVDVDNIAKTIYITNKLLNIVV